MKKSGNRKQTKLWTCKDGTRIRICDMTDSHLLNTIAYLERYTVKKQTCLVLAPNPFCGDIAESMFDNEQGAVLEEGLEPSDVCASYDNLVAERERRNLIQPSPHPRKRYRPVGDEDLFPTEPDSGCDDDREDEGDLFIGDDAGISYMDFGDN
jgi:hypothetical protein